MIVHRRSMQRRRVSPAALSILAALVSVGIIVGSAVVWREHKHAAQRMAVETGFTPLHRAAEQGQMNSLRVQLANGARVNVRDELGMTPLHYAAEGGQAAAAQLLIDAGADVNARGKRGWSPLHMAAALGHAEVVRLLLRSQAKPNAPDDAGLTPLHCAAAEGERASAQALLEGGADPNAADRRGWTCLDDAAYERRTELAALLRSCRAHTGIHSGRSEAGPPLRSAPRRAAQGRSG